MGLNLSAVHSNGRGVVTRVSDDHAYPGVEEDAPAVARHIWHCAANSLWLGPFFCCDWDMFRTSEWHAGIHAAARAVSGGPVYVSDSAEKLDLGVLSPLLLPDSSGRIVPCADAGRPAGRHAFVDPTTSREAWLVVNRTAAGWIAVAFGLCPTGGELLRATLLPGDLEDGGSTPGELACLQVDLAGPGHAAAFTSAGWDVAVHHMHFAVLALAPVLDLGGGRRLAVLGLRGVWNATGTLAEAAEAAKDGTFVHVHTLCAGELLVWSEAACTLELPGSACCATSGGEVVAISAPKGRFKLHVK